MLAKYCAALQSLPFLYWQPSTMNIFPFLTDPVAHHSAVRHNPPQPWSHSPSLTSSFRLIHAWQVFLFFFWSGSAACFGVWSVCTNVSHLHVDICASLHCCFAMSPIKVIKTNLGLSLIQTEHTLATTPINTLWITGSLNNASGCLIYSFEVRFRPITLALQKSIS